MPMPTYRNTNYSIFYATLAIMVICGLAIGGRLIRPVMHKILGGIELRKHEKAFQTLQHPAGTTSLAMLTTLGVLTEAEQGCDLFVGEIRQYDGNREAITTGYVDKLVKGSPIQAVFLEEGNLPPQVSTFLPDPINTLAGWDLPPGSAGQPMYMIYILIAGFEGNMKLNCR